MNLCKKHCKCVKYYKICVLLPSEHKKPCFLANLCSEFSSKYERNYAKKLFFLNLYIRNEFV